MADYVLLSESIVAYYYPQNKCDHIPRCTSLRFLAVSLMFIKVSINLLQYYIEKHSFNQLELGWCRII
jgi:hypothetical protein